MLFDYRHINQTVGIDKMFNNRPDSQQLSPKIGFDKILGKGNINEKIRVVNMKVSKKAKQKIERAGGSIEER